jgi:predicted TIM-barrel fold metal-dependent hydrolase
MMPTSSRIDAHMHLWDLGVSEYKWLGPQRGALNSSWTRRSCSPPPPVTPGCWVTLALRVV